MALGGEGGDEAEADDGLDSTLEGDILATTTPGFTSPAPIRMRLKHAKLKPAGQSLQ